MRYDIWELTAYEERVDEITWGKLRNNLMTFLFEK